MKWKFFSSVLFFANKLKIMKNSKKNHGLL